jgi:hypothetical protein
MSGTFRHTSGTVGRGVIALRVLVGLRDNSGTTAAAMLYVNGEPVQGFDVRREEALPSPE